jgi:hypothetical protein
MLGQFLGAGEFFGLGFRLGGGNGQRGPLLGVRVPQERETGKGDRGGEIGRASCRERVLEAV